VLLAYALPMASIAVPGGRWADGADVRSTLHPLDARRGGGEHLEALAPTFGVLLIARVLQGMAAGLIVAVYMPIVIGSVREEQRGRAIGYIITIMTIGGIAGTAGGIGMTVRTIAMTVGPAVAALSWTMAGGGVTGFRAGLLTLLVAAGQDATARAGAPIVH
jgi:predicted MFS family arabinose efflux permease